MTAPDRFEAVHAEVNPAAHLAETSAARLKLLDGDEIIQLSIKPSLWYVPLVSLKFVLAAALVASVVLISSQGVLTWQGNTIVAGAACVALLRLMIASLQWASRLYVLTNRRVVRFHGVLRVQVAESPLANITKAQLDVAYHQRAVRLGSIRMTPAAPCEVITWEDVARPSEVYEILAKAIRRAHSGTQTPV